MLRDSWWPQPDVCAILDPSQIQKGWSIYELHTQDAAFRPYCPGGGCRRHFPVRPLVRALLKYLRSGEVRKEKAETKRSLGEALKAHRTRCKMTQEFVAETIGVSRQAVSKWESGASDPSTSNLLALAKLYGVSAEDLLREAAGE